MKIETKKTTEQLREFAQDQVDSMRARMNSSSEYIASDPINAIRSVDSMARDAGRLVVAASVLRLLQDAENTADVIALEATAQALRAARFNSNRSTSVGANLMDDATLAAWADLAVWLGAF